MKRWFVTLTVVCIFNAEGKFDFKPAAEVPAGK